MAPAQPAPRAEPHEARSIAAPLRSFERDLERSERIRPACWHRRYRVERTLESLVIGADGNSRIDARAILRPLEPALSPPSHGAPSVPYGRQGTPQRSGADAGALTVEP